MNVLDFFQGVFSFPVQSDMVKSACFLRGVEPNSSAVEHETKTLDLVLADMLVMLSRSSMGFSNTSSTDSFSMTLRGDYVPLSDRQAMRNEANQIYKKYGEVDFVRETSAINI